MLWPYRQTNSRRRSNHQSWIKELDGWNFCPQLKIYSIPLHFLCYSHSPLFPDAFSHIYVYTALYQSVWHPGEYRSLPLFFCYAKVTEVALQCKTFCSGQKWLQRKMLAICCLSLFHTKSFAYDIFLRCLTTLISYNAGSFPLPWLAIYNLS